MNGFISRAAMVALVAGLCAGCVTTSTSLFHNTSNDPPPAPWGHPQTVTALWEQRVIMTPDVANGGKPLVGLAGRMYLFGEVYGSPVQSKGSIVVDCNEFRSDGSRALIERWEIDPLTLSRLGRKDEGIGWGYTLFLPWQTYRPDIKRVEMQVKFVPEKGIPLFSQPSAVTLQYEETPPPMITTRVEPVSAKK
jgi:hypothetical protein